MFGSSRMTERACQRGSRTSKPSLQSSTRKTFEGDKYKHKMRTEFPKITAACNVYTKLLTNNSALLYSHPNPAVQNPRLCGKKPLMLGNRIMPSPRDN